MYIPIIIEGFTSLSPDAMTISVSFLFIAYVFNLKFNPDIKKINLKHKVILAILSIIIALCKIVYIPLVGLLMLLQKEKFKSTKQKWINVVLIGGVALIINLIWLKISAAYLTDFRGGDSKFQVLNILMNPINYMQMLLYSIDLNGNSYILSMFGSNLGWGELVNLNSIIPYALFILLIGITIIENDIKDKFNIFDKTIIIDARTQAVAKRVSDYLKETDRYSKTIIFCVDIEHAERMRRALINENMDLIKINF